ncbi:class I SAM-dependent methyltransferase [Roseimaritima sediminicola]|uniref:class I SAM-dependent methyltransferase n=1 Tax=Roseimaritima sediminicola TaxID=2662066 RepID=UPI00129848A0|nr:class I SAM-dependent methyltransferase [Roseimaritima sediminicola]
MKTDNWYDYPQYFDLVFRDETAAEVRFFEAAFKEFAEGSVRRLLEPGCGGGRLIVDLAARGYDMTGLDLSKPSLTYLRRRLRRRGLQADLRHEDMASFRLEQPVDAAFCTFNTFRHLLSEQDAVNHLHCVAHSLRPGGIYILGFHIIPLDADEDCTERWKARHGGTEVSVTLSVRDFNRAQRREQMRATLTARRAATSRVAARKIRCQSDFDLRLYTAPQVERMFRKVEAFELVETFDFDYDIEHPRDIDDDLIDALFVLRRVP